MMNRVPSIFFETKGTADSDQPIHVGAFHQALYAAGIHSFNIVKYSSVLPACAILVDRNQVELPCFGSELYTIMAVENGSLGEQISAGIIYGWLYDPDTNEKLGGIVCEIGIHGTEQELRMDLQDALEEMHTKTFSKYLLKDVRILMETHTVAKKHGTVLCALCFTEYRTQEEAASKTFAELICEAKELRKKQNLAGYGGTTLPGSYILKKCPDFFQRLKGSVRTVMVGGTNGKTTTTSMIVHILRSKGFRVFSNREGANKTEGIATSLALHCNAQGQLDYDFAVIECDELFLQAMAEQLAPEVLVLTNIYTDQVERLISAEHTTQEIIRAVMTLTSCSLCLNRKMDGYKRIAEAYHGKAIIPYCVDSEHTVEVGGNTYALTAKIPLKCNVENAAAAASVMAALDLLDETSLACLAEYHLPFGRCDNIILPCSEITVMLAKNQIALEANLSEFASMCPDCILLLCYEDPAEYLWLTALRPETYQIFASAIRIYTIGQFADDMLRIVQEKCSCSQPPEVLSDGRFMQLCKTTEHPILAAVGYDGMLKLNKLLAVEHYTKPFWEE